MLPSGNDIFTQLLLQKALLSNLQVSAPKKKKRKASFLMKDILKDDSEDVEGFTRPFPKKSRKPRTAFTTYQLSELENRFNRQHYLTPIDRDEIAAQLSLAGSQVITWFQNRRAKMKREFF